MFAVSLAGALKLGDIVQRLELPRVSDNIASTWLSPSIFWIVYTVCVLILPEWLVGFIPFVYFMCSSLADEKRN